MLSVRTTRKQTGWRIDPVIINRVKEVARKRKISANDYVESVLSEATKDVESEEERLARAASNNAFLTAFAGKWNGDESAGQILASGKSDVESKDVVVL